MPAAGDCLNTVPLGRPLGSGALGNTSTLNPANWRTDCACASCIPTTFGTVTPAARVGTGVGAPTGEALGTGVGATLGTPTGEALGTGVGATLGTSIGEALGTGVAEAEQVGDGTGAADGTAAPVGDGTGVAAGEGVAVGVVGWALPAWAATVSRTGV